MLRVALFFDGKNFYAGWKDRAHGRKVVFANLSRWLVAQIAPDALLWGAYYYTGVDTGEAAETEGQRKLGGFLEMLELQPGFFVKRLNSKLASVTCQACGHESRYTEEKEVDTSIVADMVRLAATDGYDVAVLISGDSDHAPAVEAARALGKQAFVATWGGVGLAPRLRKAAYDHIDLVGGLEQFAADRVGGFDAVELIDADDDAAAGPEAEAAGARHLPWNPMRAASHAAQAPARDKPAAENTPIRRVVAAREPNPEAPEDIDELFISEVARAESVFAGGFVGLNYFLTRWSSPQLDRAPEDRRRVLERLVDEGRLEIYDAPNSDKAIRLKQE